MNRIVIEGRDLIIESLVTFQQMIESVTIGGFAHGIFREAARARSVSRMIRNQSTLGGELASVDSVSATAAVILALDGSVQLWGSGEETVPASLFFAQRKAWLGEGAVITGIRVPEMEHSSGCDLQKLSVIASSKPILCVATMIRREGNRAVQVRVAVSGGCPVPLRLRLLERHLEGSEITEETLHDLHKRVKPLLAPPTDLQATAGYRQEVAPVLVRRSLLRSWESAAWELQGA